MKLKYSVYGNCQADALAQCLNQVSEFKKKYDYIPLKAVQDISSNDLESIQNKLSKLDLIIYQPISDNYRIPELSTTQIRKFLPDSAVKISFPSLYYNGYFPHLARLSQLMSRNNMVHDYNIMAGYLKNISENDLYKIISDPNFYSKEESFNLHENSLSNLEKRELTNKVDIQLSDFIKNNYQKNKLFNHFDHPTGFIFSFLVKAILKKLDMAEQEAEIESISKADHLGRIEYLIYPSTQTHLDLKFDNDFSTQKVFGMNGKKYYYPELIHLFYQFYDSINDRNKLAEVLETKKPGTLEKLNQYMSKSVKHHVTSPLPESLADKGKLDTQIFLKEPRPLFANEQNLAVLWSAKAGCTFAVKYFFYQIGLLEEALLNHKWIHNFRTQVFYKSQNYQPETIIKILNPDVTIIKFVRNPYLRVVSGYLGYCQSAYENKNLSQATKIFLKKISVFLNREITKESTFSFREFVSYLETEDLFSCDIHRRVQVTPAESQKLYAAKIHLVKLENSSEQLPKIETSLNLLNSSTILLSKSSHHTSEQKIETDFCGDLHFFKTRKCPLPEYKYFYDEDLLERVYNLYQLDFEKYDYNHQSLNI